MHIRMVRLTCFPGGVGDDGFLDDCLCGCWGGGSGGDKRGCLGDDWFIACGVDDASSAVDEEALSLAKVLTTGAVVVVAVVGDDVDDVIGCVVVVDE